MWPPHRQAVLTNQCVRPGPKPRLAHRPCPCPVPGPGFAAWPCWRLEPCGVFAAAALYGELLRYLESLLRLAFQSAGEGQKIQVSVSSGGCREGQPRDGPCVHRGSEEAKKEGYREQGTGPDLRSMWDGFSVDRYAPRGLPGPPPPAQEGCSLHGRSCRTPRSRPGKAPVSRSRSEQKVRSRQRSSLQQQPRRGGRSRAGARRPPRSGVGASGRSSREPPPGDGVAVAKVTGRTKPKSPPEPAASALSWAAGRGEADGDTTLRPRRAACDCEVKATKLVEQRNERIRKTLMEKQGRELMEKSRMVHDGLKSRKLGRHIAARICLHELERYRKSQASLRLQNLRSRTQEQTAQYQAELRAMKERVASAPYLFEQVTQNNIRGTVDRLFSRVLRRLQLDEALVLKLGAVGGRGDLRLVDLEGGSWDAAARPPRSDDNRCLLLQEPRHECGSADCAGRQDSAAR